VKQDIDRLVARIAPDSGPGMTEGARELLEEIAASSGPVATSSAPRQKLWRLALPLTTVLTAVIVIAGWLLPGGLGLGPRPASALDIRQDGGYYVITVKQLFADPKRYETELRARGIDISLTVEPVSPSMVGAVIPLPDERYNGLSLKQVARRTDLISSIQRPGTCAGIFTCTIGLKVPVGYRGKGDIRLGRKGRPGERFRAFGQLNNPGEPLQCVNYTNLTVAVARPMLTAHHVEIKTFAVPLKGIHSSVPGSWFVPEGWLTEPGKALLVAAPTRTRTPFPLDSHCPTGSCAPASRPHPPVPRGVLTE